ncbi:gamma-glutamyltranspeptidase / glutathione hydrolase [Rheinheimera pacifica]|uniref:Glutathione hydrolase proenzyme n=1 Tax=Rheinheimera pacifica TaxID=173990 RepID=A0A1H6MFF7_9GAMM|nr:gamma-glutamyltransferase [Rheinheimera pacifica]SEH97744.1 gamma-glutamyltranspeptidase / glutathione hydrolase [Rheinheimera pacifica]
MQFLYRVSFYLLFSLAVLSPAAQACLKGQAAVASPDQYGALVAEQILKKGGNAVDAAVATAFTLAVTYPEAGNIGGGGFMTLWFDGKAYFLDYRETAPAAAHRDMYLDEEKQVIENLSLIGHKASGVPGTVMGLWQAHQRFGSLSWAELVQPAISYAQNGFTVAENQYQYRADLLSQLEGKTNFGRYFAAMQPNENFIQNELASTLKRIAEHGPADFYQGETAKLLVAQMQRGDGLITLDDLAAYKAGWREPVITPWRDYQLVTAAPPSSGGIALSQLLALKQRRSADFNNVALNSSQYVHLIAEIEKRVFADRADYLGDPDFTAVPQQQLLDSAYLDKRAAEINPAAISATAAVKPGLEGYHTTHFSVLDKDGNAVSNTYTLNLDFGSGVVVEGAGFLLNNEMDDFSAKAGVPNAFGVVGSDANAIAPGKRMLSSMTPSLLLKDSKIELVIGTPGGSTIFTSIFQVMTNLYDYQLPLSEAVAAPRFHHQLLPKDQITMEPYAPLKAAVQDELKAKGYQLVTQGWNLGDIQAIQVLDGKVTAAADPRSRGVAKVINLH